MILLVLRQYIGAANQLAPIYWRCKHLKNPQNFLCCKMSVCLCLLALQAQVAPIYWCYEHRSTNILVLLVLAAPISAHTNLFTTWLSVQFLEDGSMPTPSPVSKGWNQIYSVIWLHSHPPLPPANRKIFKKEKCCKCLQHHAYSCQTMPIQSAGVSGSGNRFITRWRPN